MRVVGLGAWCDFVTEDEFRSRLVRERPQVSTGPGHGDGPPQPGLVGWSDAEVEEAVRNFRRDTSFDVHEFAVLDDGRRVTLHEERGFGLSGPEDLWRFLTLESLERDVLATVLPDDDDTGDEHPWEWLAGLLRVHRVECSPEDLRGLPYEVVFSGSGRDWWLTRSGSESFGMSRSWQRPPAWGVVWAHASGGECMCGDPPGGCCTHRDGRSEGFVPHDVDCGGDHCVRRQGRCEGMRPSSRARTRAPLGLPEGNAQEGGGLVRLAAVRREPGEQVSNSTPSSVRASMMLPPS